LVVMGEQDPDFPSPKTEADWIAGVLHAEVTMVPEAGHYPQSQRPDVMTDTVLQFPKRLDSWTPKFVKYPSLPSLTAARR
jgi:pimeloyl-ACP methyl ester carboxylesterase